MVSRSEFLARMATLADELGLTDPTSPVVVQPSYPALRSPVDPNVTTSVQSGKGAFQPSAGASLTVRDRNLSDYWLGWKANTIALGPVVMQDIILRNFGPLIVMRGSPDITIERVSSIDASASGSYGIGILRATDAIGRLRVNDFRFEGAKMAPNSADAWAVIALWGKDPEDVCRDWEIRNGVIRNAQMADGSFYQNVDGISMENGHSDGLIEDVFIDTVSDAGLDIKGDNVRIHQVEVHNARQSFKLWGKSERHGRLISHDPRFAHIIAKPTTGPIVIERLEAFGDPMKPLVAFESGVTNVVVKSLECSAEQILCSKDSDAKSSTLTLPDGRVL